MPDSIDGDLTSDPLSMMTFSISLFRRDAAHSDMPAIVVDPMLATALVYVVPIIGSEL